MLCPNCQQQNRDTAKVCAQCGKPLLGASIQRYQALIGNRYHVVKEIGRGGMGAVYLAEDTQAFNRRRGIKEMLLPTNPGELQDAEYNFRREAELLAKISHPRIPDLHAYFVENGKYYLVMEWVEGENLEKILGQNGKPLDEHEVIAYAIQVSEVLEYLASQNPPVIHRDIKPENIIVDTLGQVHLVDFGIARAKPTQGIAAGKDTSIWGTQGYAAPEQYLGQTEPRSDVYALGATLHHLLTGKDPRDSSTRQFDPIHILAPDVSIGTTQLIEQMLDPIVANRPSARELRQSFTAVMDVKPLRFPSGKAVYSIRELVNVCDQDHVTAVQFLKDHHIEDWLKEIGRADLASAIKTIRVDLNRRRATANPAEALESVLHILDPNLSHPQLSIVTPSIQVSLLKGTTRNFSVEVKSNNRHIMGEIIAQPSFYFTAPDRFECAAPTFRTTITFRFNPFSAYTGTQRATLLFKTARGNHSLDVNYTITNPAPSPKPNVIPPTVQPASRPVAVPPPMPPTNSPVAKPGAPLSNPTRTNQTRVASLGSPVPSPAQRARHFPRRLYLTLLMLAPLLACVLGFMGLGTNLAAEIVLLVTGLLGGLVLATIIALMAYVLS